MIPQQPVVGVLLTADRGSRLDVAGAASKLLVPLPNGVPVAVRTAQCLMQALNDVVAAVPVAAVHDAQVDQLTTLLAKAGYEVLRYPNTARSMGVSSAADVAARPQVGGWTIALADMPWIVPETITQVVSAVDPHGCVALLHAGQRGHPIGSRVDFFTDLTALDDDEGARQLTDPTKLISTEADDAGILRDIDTPADLIR